jgi:hypothetical protein
MDHRQKDIVVQLRTNPMWLQGASTRGPVLEPVVPGPRQTQKPSPGYIQSLADLTLLEKPVKHITGYQNLPDSLKTLH